jgi:sugar lactone lactonase YvrE
MKTNPHLAHPAHRRGGFLRRHLVCLSLVLLANAHLAAQTAAQTTAPLLPAGVAYDASGNLYFADTNRHQVFESTLAGQLLTVAGSGVQGFSGDGGAATSAALNGPQGVAIGPDGTLYIADTGNHRIRMVSTGGTISTFAGTGAAGYSGDDGPPAAAVFDRPTALAIDNTGALLVCDTDNHRIRRIAAATVTTVAGTGVQGFSGDGGPAAAAQLDTPSGLAIAADGRLFVADTRNHRVRVISAAGTISTFAGTGVAGYAGDGGPATAAQLARPQGLYMTTAALLIADSNNQRIRRVNAQGTIATIAGNGVQGSSSDGAVATSVSLDTPRTVTQSSFASPVFADAGNRLVRELVANGNLYLPAGLQPTRTSNVALTAVAGATYGQPVATASVTGSAGTPQGVVQLYDGASLVTQALLAAGVATFASATLSAGTHTLSAAYLGDGVNPAATSAAASAAIAKAASITIEPSSPQAGYTGLPLVLTASVAPATQGTPTGVVNFIEGSTTVATGTLSAGTATGVYLAPSAGSHAIVASYGGDANFMSSTSAAVTATVGAMPDFTLASFSSATQTASLGGIAVYILLVAAQPAPFTGAVSMSVSGLPKGVTAAFAPPQAVPGASSAQVTLTVQVPTTLASLQRPQVGKQALWALLLLVCIPWKRRPRGSLLAALLAVLLLSSTGCGDRTLSGASQPSQSFALTVTGTGTNLAGAAVTHSTALALVVQ